MEAPLTKRRVPSGPLVLKSHVLPSPSIVEVVRRLFVPIKLSGTFACSKVTLLLMPFSEEIINAPKLRKARLRGTQQVMNTESGTPKCIHIMTFSRFEGRPIMAPHDDPLVIALKVVSALVCRILIDTGMSANIITWQFLKKLKYLGMDITPLVHPILEFRGQQVNLVGMIRLPLWFRDKVICRNLKVKFLVVDVPTAYNIDQLMAL
ncbi:hypothetical protein Cgig2_029407 [Carnegiea gigantea]|uniref:Uncharacterized protein n=1 Tax=Carnegiea gigantea TaxID=171969 RepID=A0A9Q1JFF1_9CARY|nr:hypothetical protein Cgig2_029407 [Carnegiea gigantea]